MDSWQNLPVPKYRNSIRHFRADESYAPSYFAHLVVRKSIAFEKHTNSRFPVSGHRFLRFRLQVFPSNCRPLAWCSIVFFWLFLAYLMMTHSVQSCFVPKSKVAVTNLQFGRGQNLNMYNWHQIFQWLYGSPVATVWPATNQNTGKLTKSIQSLDVRGWLLIQGVSDWNGGN